MTYWKDKRVLITSGPTREHLDPIRFLTNASSGRMGFAIAIEAARLGARVTVVSGPTAEPPPPEVRVVRVVSGLEMFKRALALCAKSDVVIAAAAVSDWRFKAVSVHKIKRGPRPLRLTLVPNPDIIKEASRRRRPGQILVGFALETRRALESARGKLDDKGLDLIVANGPSSLGGWGSRAWVLGRRQSARRLRMMSKRLLAREILNAVEREWHGKSSPR